MNIRVLTLKLCAVLLLLASMSACDVDNLTIEKAEAILDRTYADKLSAMCSLDNSLSEHAEFFPLKDGKLCEARHKVTEIFFISHNAVNAKYRIVTVPKPEVLGKWLTAFEQLEARLRESQEPEKLKQLRHKLSEDRGRKELVLEEGKTNFTHYDFGWSVAGGSR